MDVDRLRADEEAGWIELGALFGRVPLERFAEPSVTPDGWSTADVMFHVIAWCDEASDALDRARVGAPDPQDGEDTETKNHRFLKISQGMDADEIRSRFSPARDRLLRTWDALDEITPHAWEWFEESGPRHYADHAKDLRGWLESGP